MHEIHRNKLIRLIGKIAHVASPSGWRHVASLGVSGLYGIGFSKTHTNMMLVVTSSGRGLFNCNTGEKIERNYDDIEWLDYHTKCMGLGVTSNEEIEVARGGLLLSTPHGEHIEKVSPEWPKEQLVFVPPQSILFMKERQKGCEIFYSEYIKYYGFSWCGNYLIASCSSDVEIWKRKA